MSKKGEHIWMNGKIISGDEGKISLYSHVIHYGTGAFEGIRAYRQTSGGGAIFRLREHMQRLVETLKILALDSPYTVEQLCEAAVQICKANKFEECYLRPIAYIGEGPLGVYPGPKPPVEIAILTWEWGKYLGDKVLQEGTKLSISSYLRPHPASIMSKGKISGQYVTGVLAKRDAIARGFDEALMLDTEGYMSEGTGENLFMVKDGVVKTTPLTSILNGITRNTVVRILEKQGVPVKEARFTRDELICADEIFLTGTAAEVTPVASIDMMPIGFGPGAGKPGPISLNLAKDYGRLIRGEWKFENSPEWLTAIR